MIEEILEDRMLRKERNKSRRRKDNEKDWETQPWMKKKRINEELVGGDKKVGEKEGSRWI